MFLVEAAERVERVGGDGWRHAVPVEIDRAIDVFTHIVGRHVVRTRDRLAAAAGPASSAAIDVCRKNVMRCKESSQGEDQNSEAKSSARDTVH